MNTENKKQMEKDLHTIDNNTSEKKNPLIPISKRIEEQFQELEKYVTEEKLLLKKLFDFELNQTKEQLNKKIEKAVSVAKGKEKSFAGIYFFEIKKDGKDELETWLETFQKNWEEDKKNFHLPSYNKTRSEEYLKVLKKDSNWIPLYIGKAQNMQKRFENHITLNKESGTYAMKLMYHSTLKKHSFRVRVLQIPIEAYPQVATCLEAAFRKKYKPIVGKK